MNWPPTYLQWFLIIGLPLMGMVYAFLGGIKLAMTERLKLDEGKVGGLVAGFGMMVGPTILACGFLADAFGRKGVFLAGATTVVLALLVLASARTYGVAVLGVLLLGTGWSATINVGNVLMLGAGDSATLTQRMQFFDFLFGFGALATPMVIGMLLPRLGYSGAIRILAVVSMVPLIMSFFAPMETSGGSAGSGTLQELFTGSVFWLTSLAFLFYVPLESSVAGWATTIVSRQSSPDSASSRLAGFSLMAFWLCFTGSRLLVALSGIEKGRDLLLVALSIASVAVILGIVFLPGRWTAVSLIIVAGLVFGPIFPILISKMLGTAPKGVEGRAVGFFFAFGSVGWTLIPRLIGNVASRTNIQRGFLVAAASGAIFMAIVLAQHFRV